MADTVFATFALALVRAREKLPLSTKPIDVPLSNATGGALAEGDLVMLDMTSAGVDSDGNYFRVIAPTTAGNLATAGSYHLVCQNTVASGAPGIFRFFGDTKLKLNASSATIGTLLYTRGTNKDATSAVTAGGKIIGKTKIATTTGVVRVLFDGRGLAVVPTLVGLKSKFFATTEIYVGTTTPFVTGTVEIATNSKCVNKTWNSDPAGSNAVTIGWTDWKPEKAWDLGTVTFRPVVSSASATGGAVTYDLSGGAVSDADSLNLTVGSAVTSVATLAATANTLATVVTSAAITIGGTPAAGDLVKLRISRTSAAGNVDISRLHGFHLFYTVNATTDD